MRALDYALRLAFFATVPFLATLITVLFPVCVAIGGYDWWEVAVTGGLAILVIVRHAANIRRLLGRSEIDLTAGQS